MTRKNKRGKRERRGFDAQEELTTEFKVKKSDDPLSPLTEAQGHYMIAIEQAKIIISSGPAGTGKTYVSGCMAAEALLSRSIERIILTRPAIEAGENLGFLPGELEDKYEPYLRPFKDIFYEKLGKGHTEYLIKSGRIEPAPLAYMRGRTFKDSWVILDEAQNTTPKQMKMLLTRMGNSCKVIVNGDVTQTDIQGQNGLADAMARLKAIRGVNMIKFYEEDIVRSGMVREIVKAYG